MATYRHTGVPRKRLMTQPVTSTMPATIERNSRGMIKIPRLIDSVVVPAASDVEAAEETLV